MSRRRYRLDDDVPDQAAEFLRSALEDHGWERTRSDDWHFYWSFVMHPAADYRTLKPDQRVNHFPGIGPIHFKDELYHFLVEAKQRVESQGITDSYDFFPQTFPMPWGYDALCAAAEANRETMWIAKPKRLAAGEGVHVVEDVSNVDRSEHWLVQEYIAEPLLLPDFPHKSELRVYVLVTSLVPLVAYMYHDGIVRYASRPHTNARESRSDRLVHLTSVGIQRGNPDTPEPVQADDFPTYRRRLRRAGFDDDALFARTRELVINTLLAHREPVLDLSRNLTDRLDSCMELLGFDVLLDRSGKPWLAEVNRSPDIEASDPGTAQYEVRRRVKQPMVRDMTTLIGCGQVAFDAGTGVARFVAELSRRGGWEPIFPAADALEIAKSLDVLRSEDEALIEGLR